MRRISVLTALLVLVVGAWSEANAQSAAKAAPPSVPTVALDNVARHGFFYAGGKYVGELGTGKESTMGGAMYVEVMVPRQIRSPYPIVLLHGAGQTGVDWLQTPDGRPGWAYNFLEMGYVVYLQDFPARGRSQYVPGVDGTPGQLNLNIRTAPNLEETFTASAGRKANFPNAQKHTQWPGTGRMGDKIFDNFIRTQVQSAGAAGVLTVPAGIALLDMIGSPVILFTHSQGGGFGFEVTEARPKLVKAMVTVEPGGPQFGGADTATVTPRPRNPNSWGLTTARFEYSPPANAPSDLEVVLEEQSERPDEVRCWMQVEPARELARWQNVPVLAMSANGTYHRVYDPCIPRFLKQAGVKADFVRLETVGISGNSHMMMLEKNSDDIITFVVSWLQKNVNGT